MMRYGTLSILCLLSTNLLADSSFIQSEYSEEAFSITEFDGEVESEFSTEIGASITSGNTDTQTYKGKAQGSFTHQLGRASYHGEYFKKSSDQAVSAEKWKIGVKNNFDFSQHASSFMTAEYEQDQFSDFDSVATFAAGYTQLMFNEEGFKWHADIGPGYKLKHNPQESLSEYVMHLGSNLSVQLSDQAQFIQTLVADLSLRGDSSDVVRAESALLTSVLENLKMKLSYALKHNSNPADDNVKLDTQTTVSMVFIF